MCHVYRNRTASRSYDMMSHILAVMSKYPLGLSKHSLTRTVCCFELKEDGVSFWPAADREPIIYADER